jgi:hypothetical protein
MAAPETLADLLDQLGGVPLSRVRMNPPPGTATLADMELAPKPPCELIDGTLVNVPGDCYPSMLSICVSSRILDVVHEANLGVMAGSGGGLQIANGLVRSATVSYIPWDAIPGDELLDEVFWSVCPALIVEVLSPGNTKAEIDRKLREFFAAGCKLAWVIDPATKTAKVHTSATKAKALDETGVLDGGKVLPGFQLSLAELFAVGTRKRKKKK